MGLKRHDRIGIYSPNNYEWTVNYQRYYFLKKLGIDLLKIKRFI